MAQEERPPTISAITCQEIVRWASAYLDEHVEEERRRQITVHLAICVGCEVYVEQIAMVRDVVALLPTPVEKPSDSHRLRQVFAARTRQSLSNE